MPIKKENVFAARLKQLFLIGLNLAATVLATITLGMAIGEYDDLALAVVKMKKEDGPKFGFFAGKDIVGAKLVEGAIHFALANAVLTVVVTFVLNVAVVVESRKLIIANIVTCAFLASTSLVAGVFLFLAKDKAVELMTIAFEKVISTEFRYENLNKHFPMNAHRTLVDHIQINGKCCGFNAYTDYRNFSSITNLDKQQLIACVKSKHFGYQQIPYTCCRTGSRDCVTNIFDQSCASSKRPVNVGEKIYTVGCKSQIDQITELDRTGGLFLGQCICFVIVTVLLYFLIQNVVDVLPLQLPPKRELQELGFGDSTIRMLAEHAEEMNSQTEAADEDSRRENRSAKGNIGNRSENPSPLVSNREKLSKRPVRNSRKSIPT